MINEHYNIYSLTHTDRSNEKKTTLCLVISIKKNEPIDFVGHAKVSNQTEKKYGIEHKLSIA